MSLWRVLSNLTRRKTLESDMLKTPLRRCLNTFDLTILGLAQMIGAGIFVLGGTVSSSIAGPGVILSFLIAGLAAILSALCYAEFGSLIPRTGSAYLFTYVVLGEAVGFTAGWAIISEQVMGMAATARALSATLDDLFGNWVQNQTLEALGRIELPGLNPYPDLLALGPIIITHTIVISGVKNTAIVGNLLTVVQVLVLVFITVVGFTRGDISNWRNKDRGGFLPYGFGGVLSGAASCFFAYVGFDSIAIAGEEAKTPRKSIPRALLVSMLIVCSLYILSSSSLTLMQPYYDVDPLTPFQEAFKAVGLPWVNYIVIVGSVLALSTTLMCGMYATPRIIYAMASDGLLFACMAKVNSCTKAPVHAAVVSTIFTVLFAVFIDMEVLVELFSIVTLMTFTLVAIALMKFHYLVPDNSPLFQPHLIADDESRLIESKASSESIGTLRPLASHLPFVESVAGMLPVDIILVAMLTCQVIFGIFVVVGYHTVGLGNWFIIIFLVVSGLLGLSFFILLALHHTNDHSSGFRVPFSPLLETMSVSINLGLMFMLKPLTWARFTVWILIGAVLYLLYGIRYSKEGAATHTPTEPDVDLHSESEGAGYEYHALDGPIVEEETPNNYGSLNTVVQPQIETCNLE